MGNTLCCCQDRPGKVKRAAKIGSLATNERVSAIQRIKSGSRQGSSPMSSAASVPQQNLTNVSASTASAAFANAHANSVVPQSKKAAAPKPAPKPKAQPSPKKSPSPEKAPSPEKSAGSPKNNGTSPKTSPKTKATSPKHEEKKEKAEVGSGDVPKETSNPEETAPILKEESKSKNKKKNKKKKGQNNKPDDGVERRRDKTNGEWYSKSEFAEFYGEKDGGNRWEKAEAGTA